MPFRYSRIVSYVVQHSPYSGSYLPRLFRGCQWQTLTVVPVAFGDHQVGRSSERQRHKGRSLNGHYHVQLIVHLSISLRVYWLINFRITV